MGSDQSQMQRFDPSNWRQVSSLGGEIIQYENTSDKNIHIEKHHIQTINNDQYEEIKEFSYIRKNNPRWVSALYFEEGQGKSEQFCASKYVAQLYLEKIPIRLCDLKNIPFPDSLHLYDQALNGFYELARLTGCFPVESEFIGINQRGVIKVWAGPKWPLVTVRGGVISQEDMVRSIIECLQECIDKTSMPTANPSIRNFLYRDSDRINFEQAIFQFKNYVRFTNVGGIPSKLNSIEDSPGRYDTDRQINTTQYISEHYNIPLEKRNYIGSQPSQMLICNNSPRFSMRRQVVPNQQQFTTFRRVQSLSNQQIQMQRPPAISHFAPRQNKQPFIESNPYVSQGTIDRSQSIPRLQSGQNIIRPNSSLRQLVQPVNYPINHSSIQSQRPSIAYHFENQLRPQIVNHIYKPLYQPSNQIPQQKKAVQFSQYIQAQQIYNNEQSRPLTIIRQPQLTIYPPSQTQIPAYVGFPQQNTLGRPPQMIIQDQQPSNKLTKKSTLKDGSIIMQLYNSQVNPSSPRGQSKQFGFVKRSDSIHIQLPKKLESVTIINESQSSSMRGIPTNQYQNTYMTPLGVNKKELSNLNSIEQVHTEHYWKENSSLNTSHKKQYNYAEPESLVNLNSTGNQYNYSSSVIKMGNKYTNIDENDGKSSQDFLRKLKQIGSSYPSSNTNEYNFQKKKQSLDLADTYHQYKDFKFGRSAQSKNDGYSSNAYDEISKPLIGTSFGQEYQEYDWSRKKQDYEPGIDPQIWQDLKKYKS